MTGGCSSPAPSPPLAALCFLFFSAGVPAYGVLPNCLADARLWGAPQFFCGQGVLPACLAGAHIHGVPPIVLRACSLALYEVLPDCFASLLAHGVLPNLLSAGHGVLPIVLIAGAVRGFRRRAHSWGRFPIGFLQCCWHSRFSVAGTAGPPFCQAMTFTEPGALGQSERQVEGAVTVRSPLCAPAQRLLLSLSLSLSLLFPFGLDCGCLVTCVWETLIFSFVACLPQLSFRLGTGSCPNQRLSAITGGGFIVEPLPSAH